MSCNSLDIPTQVLDTVNATVMVRMAPPNASIMPEYSIVAAAPVEYSFEAAAAVAAGEKVVTLKEPLPILLSAGASLTFGSQAVIVRRVAARGESSIQINPLATDESIAADATAAYTPDANDAGDSLLHVKPLPTYLSVGTTLTYGNQQVLVTGGQSEGATLLPVKPLEAPVSADEIATTKALLLLVGAMVATPASAPKSVDRSRYISGPGAESQTVGTNRTLQLQFDRMIGDLGGETLMEILYNDDYYQRQVYAFVQFADGETFEGLAQITQGDSQGATQDKRMQTANMQYQGCSFEHTPATGNDFESLGIYAEAI